MILLKLFDEAGNEQQYYRSFTLAGEEPPVELVSIPFSVTVDGYRIEGTRSPDGTTSRATLIPPAAVGLSELDEAGTAVAVASLAFEEVTFNGDAFVAGALAAERRFALRVADFPLIGRGLTFSVTEGLRFGEIEYATEVLDAQGTPVDARFVYQGARLTFPPLVQFASAALLSQPIAGIRSVYTDDSGIARTGWLHEAIENSRFVRDAWEVYGGTLSTVTLDQTYNVRLYRLNGSTREYAVPLSRVRRDAAGAIIEGEIDATDPLYLETGGNRFRIDRALVRGGQLVIPVFKSEKQHFG